MRVLAMDSKLKPFLPPNGKNDMARRVLAMALATLLTPEHGECSLPGGGRPRQYRPFNPRMGREMGTPEGRLSSGRP
jgi:hypothetical protein